MRHTLAALFAFLLMAGFASAQDTGQIGLAMGFPANIGVLWHATDRIAIRPGISIGHSSIETTSTSTFTQPFGLPPETITSSNSFSSTSVGIELDVLIFVKKWDEVRAYVAPGYSYSRTWSTSESSTPLPALPGTTTTTTATQESTSATHRGAGIFGVQYTPHRRFAVFGELGLGFSTSESSAALRLQFDNRTFATVSRVGVVLYLR